MRTISRFAVLFVLLFAVVVVASGDPIVLTISYSPPYSTPEHDGILELILIEAFARIGEEVTFRRLPAERGLIDANSGAADGVVARIEGIETIYPSLVRVPVATIESRDFVAFSRSGLPPITRWDDLAPYNIAYVRGWKILERSVPETRSELRVHSTDMAFGLLLRSRVDVVLSARLDGLVTARRLGLTDLRVHEPPLASLSLYPFLNRRLEHLVEPLERALRAMKDDGTFSEIYDTVIAHE
ncbi:MAG: substrate-binding periplasmic protein [Spirochaetota bacterium]